MKTFELTYTQAKSIIESLGRDELETFVEKMNDQPEFLQFMGEIDSVYELVSIYEGGCASGAYMPAVTYYTANQCMASDAASSVEDQLSDSDYEIVFNPANDSFSQFASKLCAMAVESYVNQFSDIIEVLQNGDY